MAARMIKVDGYLYIKRTKQSPGYGIRATIRDNKVEAGEIQIGISLNLPENLWEKTILRAEVTVRPEDVPAKITEEVFAQIAEAVDDTLGLRVVLTKT